MTTPNHSNRFPGWTLDTLREIFLARIDEMDKRVDQRFHAIQDAVTKAEAATDKRFESVNEFRAQLGDQERTFVGRAEYASRHEAISDRLSKAESAIVGHMSEGRGVSKVTTPMWAAILTVIAGIILATVVALTPKGGRDETVTQLSIISSTLAANAVKLDAMERALAAELEKASKKTPP